MGYYSTYIGAATQLSLAIDLSELIVGSVTTVDITAQDDYGNTDIAFIGLVRVVLTGPSSSSQDVTLSAGSFMN